MVVTGLNVYFASEFTVDRVDEDDQDRLGPIHMGVVKRISSPTKASSDKHSSPWGAAPPPLTPTHPPETVSIIPRLWLAPDPNGRFTGSVPVVSGGPPATPHTDAKRATKKTRAITTLAIVSSFPRALLNDGFPQSTDEPYRCQWSAARGSELTN